MPTPPAQPQDAPPPAALPELIERRERLSKQIAQTQLAIAQTASRPLRSTKQRHLAAFRSELKTLDRQIAGARHEGEQTPETATAAPRKPGGVIGESVQAACGRTRATLDHWSRHPSVIAAAVVVCLLLSVLALAWLVPPRNAQATSDAAPADGPAAAEAKQAQARQARAEPRLIRGGALDVTRPADDWHPSPHHQPDDTSSAQPPRPPRPSVAAAVEAIIELARTHGRREAMRIALDVLPHDLTGREIDALLAGSAGPDRHELMQLLAHNVQPDSLHNDTAPDILEPTRDRPRREMIATLAPLLRPGMTTRQAINTLEGTRGQQRLLALRELADKLQKPISPTDQLDLLEGLDLNQRQQALHWLQPE